MNSKNEEDFIIDDSAIINEKKIKGENLSFSKIKIIKEKGESSICEIIKDNGYGSGFFCKIKYEKKEEINCLITNNHVITRYMLLNKDNIEIKLKNEIKKISLNKYRRLWTDEKIDFTCIEIIEEDKMIEMIKPFEIDDNCYIKEFDNKEEYKKRGIVLPSIGSTKEIELGQGIIYNIKNNKDMFVHDCNTEAGFSGGPILLINNLKIIGIHKGYESKINKNIGIYLKEIINNIKREKEIYGKNIINCIIDLKLNEIEKNILLFNSSEKNKKEIKNN